MTHTGLLPHQRGIMIEKVKLKAVISLPGRCICVLMVIISLHVPLDAQEVTWSDHIACLVYSHCTPCHNDKGIAPFPLQSYDNAFQYRYAMEAAISTRIMPPWPPGNSHQIAGKRSLSDEEVQLFRDWVETGALPGNSTEEPSPPNVQTEFEIADPDLVIQLPEFTVPDLRELDLYRCFVAMTNESEDKYITGVEIIPGNRSIVHHVILYQDTSGIPQQKDHSDPDPGYTCFGGVGTNSASMIAGWVPGSSATYTPEGMGIFFPKGATIVAQLHYPEGNAGMVDSTSIRIRFSDKEDLRRVEVLPVLNHFSSMDRPLYIPANTRQTFHQKFFPVPFDVTLVGIAPHAHLICESMKAYATTIRGDTIPLIDIPHWDFEWQGFYSFKKPVKIPAWSTVHGVASYNNTTSNHHLPGDVPVDVTVGEATTDEMMLFFFSITGYQNGDEHMVIDTASHMVHHDDCEIGSQTTATVNQAQTPSVLIGPNPTRDQLFVQIDGKPGKNLLTLTDLMGRRVWEAAVYRGLNNLSLSPDIPGGIYLYTISSDHHKIIDFGKISVIR